MTDQIITCPQCGTDIPLTDALTKKIEQQLKNQLEGGIKEKEKELQAREVVLQESQKQIEAQVTQKVEAEKTKMWVIAQQKATEKNALEFKNLQKDVEEKNQKLQELQNKELELMQQKRGLEEKEKTMQLELTRQLDQEREMIETATKKQMSEKYDLEFKDLHKEVEEKNRKLTEMQTQELELRKQKRDLEAKEKSMQLQLERQLDEERSKISEIAKKEASEENHMKILEKDKQMEQMRKTIAELKRKSEQGSTQIQGDAQENDLKTLLQTTFPLDLIEDVPTGIRGADLIQTVHSEFGQKAGIILWESKNTKAWSNDWLKKLKDDQSIAKSDICILISQTLPDDIENFGIKDGVWVVGYQFALPLVNALRIHLKEVNQVKQSLVGKGEKMEYLYHYLSGNEFKNRIENIVNAFTSLQRDLETEKRSMERIWNKRSKEIERVIINTSGLYGDLQGIIGASLPTIQALELPTGEAESLF